jgi:hypothetical protein
MGHKKAVAKVGPISTETFYSSGKPKVRLIPDIFYCINFGMIPLPQDASTVSPPSCKAYPYSPTSCVSLCPDGFLDFGILEHHYLKHIFLDCDYSHSLLDTTTTSAKRATILLEHSALLLLSLPGVLDYNWIYSNMLY